jgi:hypothetical protein
LKTQQFETSLFNKEVEEILDRQIGQISNNFNQSFIDKSGESCVSRNRQTHPSHERQQQQTRHLPGTQAVQKSIGKRKISPQTMRQHVQTLIQNDKIIKEDDGEKHQKIRK